jgi:hypothetical protein
MEIVLFFMGLFGLLGVIFSWPLVAVWIILLFVGWGVLVIDL